MPCSRLVIISFFFSLASWASSALLAASNEINSPYKDAKIVWRGPIEGDKITGKSTWIVKRWYWTVENTFEFEGKLQKEPPTTASTD